MNGSSDSGKTDGYLKRVNNDIVAASLQNRPTVAVSFVDVELGPSKDCLTVILEGDFYGYPPSWDHRKNLYRYLFSPPGGSISLKT